MGCLAIGFELSLNTWLLHLNLVLGFFLLALAAGSAFWALCGGPKSGLLPGLALLPPILLSCCLNLVYLIDFASYHLWGRDVSLALILHFASHSGELTRPGGLPRLFYASVFVSALAFSSLPWAMLGTKLCRDAARDLWGWDEAGRRFRRKIALLAFPLLVFLLALIFPSGGDLVNARAWEEEPLISLLYNRTPTFLQTAQRLRAGAEDRLAERLFKAAPRLHPPNLALIIVDDLRADRAPGSPRHRILTPFLDGLVKRGELRPVETALAEASESVGGILATLNSRSPDSLCVQNFSVLEAFRKLGYEVHVGYSGNERWYNLESNYGARPEEYLFHDGDKAPSGDDGQVLQALKALPHWDGKPHFFFLHLMSVHWSGLPDHAFDRYGPALKGGMDLLRPPGGPTHGWLAKRANFYDNRVLQVDDILRQAFAALRERGYGDNLSALILADHGEGLEEHPGNLGHGGFVYEENVRVPMLLYHLPGVPSSHLGIAIQLDAAPTLIEAAGVKPPASWEGRSLFEAPLAERLVLHDASPLNPRSACGVSYLDSGRRFKLIWPDFSTHPRGSEEFYDLIADPGEKRPLPEGIEPAIRARLHRELEIYYQKSVN